MPATSTIMKWLSRYPQFVEQYIRAREMRAHARFESVDAVLDDLRSGVVDSNQARVLIDTIKWQCGKESAKVYGDKLTLDGNISLTSIAASLREREARAGLLPAIDVQLEPVQPTPQLTAPDYPDPDAA